MVPVSSFDVLGRSCPSDRMGAIDPSSEGVGTIARCVCAFGVFDGLHRGHSELMARTMDEADARGLPSAVMTFSIDPDELFVGSPMRKLMGNDMRIEALSTSGIDAVFVVPFTEEVASLEPVEFLDRAFGDETPAVLCVGEDLRFGRGASGDVGTLRTWGEAHGMEVIAIPLLRWEGDIVTSTRIRRTLGEGDVSAANALLGHRYMICGEVVHGASKGAEMGIRTANLEVPDDRMILRDGVYVAYALIDGVPYKAAVSIGLPPTFEGERTANLEAHVLDFDGDLYGQCICIAFEARLRDMIKFESVGELVRTIENDLEAARSLPLDR